MNEIEFFGLWNPKQKTWMRTYSGALLYWPDLRLVHAYRLNHPALPFKYEIRRITQSGDPDLSTDFEPPAEPAG